MKNKLHILIIDLEYPRYEINEPINIDTIIDSFDASVTDNIEITVWYRTMGDLNIHSIHSYDVILISTKVCSFEIASYFLTEFRDKIIIVGGMLATFSPESLLKQNTDIILSMGECECNINQIIHYCLENCNIDYVKSKLIENNISGISFINNKTEEMYSSPIVPYDLSLVTTPLKHRKLAETIKKGGLVRIEGSRGCPWNKCSFCCVDWRYGTGKWRSFPEERTINEIVYLSKNNAKTIYFTDEDFIGNAGYFFSVFGKINELKKKGIIHKDIQFWGSTSVYTLIHFEKAEFLQFVELSKECGIEVLFIGIESGCDAQLKRYSKGVCAADNLQILSALKNAGIFFDVGYIMFDSGTNLREIRENIRFCKNSGLEKTVSRLAKPLRIIPHTKLYEQYRDAGLLVAYSENELSYSYKFEDDKVRILYEFLCCIDSWVLDKANAIQAKARMECKYQDEETLALIYKYRNISYDFIDWFTNAYIDKDVNMNASQKKIETLIEESG